MERKRLILYCRTSTAIRFDCLIFWDRRWSCTNTPGCTRQACAFGVAYGQLQAKGVVVIGVSKDTVTSHEKFAAKHALPFLILSDPEHRVIEAYDVWKEKKLYGKVNMGTVRATYIMDENGVIEAAMPKVKPDTNASEILAYLEKKNAADIQ